MYMLLCVILFWPSKIENSLILMQNVFKVWDLRTNWFTNVFWKIWVELKCFWKIFNLILMHFIHKILCFEKFLHKSALFFKNFEIPDFWSIKVASWSIEIAIKILVWICLARLVVNRFLTDRNWKFFSF